MRFHVVFVAVMSVSIIIIIYQLITRKMSHDSMILGQLKCCVNIILVPYNASTVKLFGKYAVLNNYKT